MNELLSCPFCGGEAHTYKNNLWHVACENALNGCVTMSAFVTEAEAIAAWNTRAGAYCAYAQPTDLTDGCALLGRVERTCHIEMYPLGLHEEDGEAPICSACRVAIDEDVYFCPNCGAKVVSE